MPIAHQPWKVYDFQGCTRPRARAGTRYPIPAPVHQSRKQIDIRPWKVLSVMVGNCLPRYLGTYMRYLGRDMYHGTVLRTYFAGTCREGGTGQISVFRQVQVRNPRFIHTLL